jgi:uncharacterized membrane protein YfcA
LSVAFIPGSARRIYHSSRTLLRSNNDSHDEATRAVELLQTTAIYLLLGAGAGTMAGLLGVGGGLIIVPALVWSFQLEGVSVAVQMHLAIGTSLATIILTSIASVRAHDRRGGVNWQVFWRLTPGIVVGALIGAAVADSLPTATLKLVFGIFGLLVAAQIAFGAKPAPHRGLPQTVGMLTAGTVIGAISAVVGIGGGSLTVPFLAWCNTSLRNAVATSAACGLPIAISGTMGFIAMGWDASERPDWSVGYIYLPALLGIAASSMLFARLGARLAHSLPTRVLQLVFATFLLIVGLNMLLG